MRYVTIILCALLVLFSVHQAQATIIHVPGDSSTIQGGINGAVDSDTVLVQPGTYVENINFNGHNIIVGSLFLTTGDTSYISSTVIDGDSSGWVVRFVNGEDNTAVITGFTIQNGYAQYSGGGIHCSNSNPTITNNTISGNSASYAGGGIYCSNSSPTISNNTISGNYGERGGSGISCDYYSSPTISNNTISGNHAGYYSGGGGIACYVSNPTISNNTISGNSADIGGGIDCFNSSPTISNNTISGNSAEHAGGISCLNSSPTISNTIIAFSSRGVAIACLPGSNPVLTCCDVYGNAGGDWVDCIAGQGGINGNFSADPLFCDTANGDLHIFAGSPCAPANNSCGILIGALDVGCFTYGDANKDGVINIADVVYLINYLFVDGPAPDPLSVGDANCDDVVNIADVVYLINYLFIDGPPPDC
jgi:parallel beta-helix repeat protein